MLLQEHDCSRGTPSTSTNRWQGSTWKRKGCSHMKLHCCPHTIWRLARSQPIQDGAMSVSRSAPPCGRKLLTSVTDYKVGCKVVMSVWVRPPPTQHVLLPLIINEDQNGNSSQFLNTCQEGGPFPQEAHRKICIKCIFRTHPKYMPINNSFILTSRCPSIRMYAVFK